MRRKPGRQDAGCGIARERDSTGAEASLRALSDRPGCDGDPAPYAGTAPNQADDAHELP